jgi:hypothetical protein
MRRCLAALALLVSPAALAQAPGQPVVVELFTSQSCSSCPPAEDYFRELAARPGLIALEWHVDYWDTLDVKGAGRWKDPFSSYLNTARQRVYNFAILHKGQIYTPQAVIGGASEATGFDRKAIEGKIREAAKSVSPIRIDASRGDLIRFALGGLPEDASVSLITFRKRAVTAVKDGENHGRTLNSANLVTGWRELNGPTYATPLPAEGDGCALLIQEPGQGRILAAALCP